MKIKLYLGMLLQDIGIVLISISAAMSLIIWSILGAISFVVGCGLIISELWKIDEELKK